MPDSTKFGIQWLRESRDATLRTGDELRRKIYTLVLADASSIAKGDGNREVADADVVKASDVLRNKINDALALVSVDRSAELQAELAIVNEFAPVKASTEECVAYATQLFEELPVERRIISSMSALMKAYDAKYPYGDRQAVVDFLKPKLPIPSRK